MSVNPLRVRKLHGFEYRDGTVVYRMCRDLRVHDNDALLFAQSLAMSKGAELVVVYTVWNHEWVGATRRFYDWVIPSLIEVEKDLRAHNIPLVITFDQDFVDHNMQTSCGAMIIDQLPLRFMGVWKKKFAASFHTVPLYEVDAHNVIPVWELSSKQEFAARTVRSKVHAKISSFLEGHGTLKVHTNSKKLLETYTSIDWEHVRTHIRCREDVAGTGDFTPGEHAAHKALKHFLDTKLSTYQDTRNNINRDGQSNLSPYISHGNLSRRRIILELLKKTKVTVEQAFDPVQNGSNGTMGSIASFIEESVVRSELCENFCFYNEKYDSYKGFPAWAHDTLHKALSDKRQYVYTREEFEKATTHDDLWNAAQRQMVKTGKMQGYMRMYWAKKILEWTKSPQEAMSIAVYLNDTYELDGRDPNGYVGCAWSIGGVHDRPWFGRPIFGTVRYMAASGVEKRGSIREYIALWGKPDNTLPLL